MKSFDLTNQEVFDLAYKGIVEQGCQSLNRYGGCVYLGKNNTHCAAAKVFITLDDDELNSAMASADLEEGGIGAHSVLMSAGYTIHPRTASLLGSLQEAHDMYAANIEMYKNAHVNIARDFDLEFEEA